jgi:deoxyribodipyrimidine photo-lyase
VRRDLRLHDNLALREAVARGIVIPLFVLDPAILDSTPHRKAERRRSFLFAALRSLDADLRARGSRLIVRGGRPLEVLSRLVRESEAGAIFAEEDYSPYSKARDRAVGAKLALHLTPGTAIHAPGETLKRDGKPYTVFTHFSRAWKALPLPGGGLSPPRSIHTPRLPSEPIPEAPEPDGFPASETEARRLLKAFVRGPVQEYAGKRDRLDLDGTSRLSPYFRLGLLSAREAAGLAGGLVWDSGDNRKEQAGAAAWLNELAWRDFYLAVLQHFPEVLRASFNPSLRSIQWHRNPAVLEAWQQGRTGYPVVDAAMRQLLSTGWMHNRGRMIVASFLVKDLLLDWKEGEIWFMQQLVDGDPAANNGGWQWAAGTGTDAAPYFRIFNPVTQGERFDPQGSYVSRWVPELAGVPPRWIHKPWEAPEAILRSAGVKLGKSYPHRIVDHVEARGRALDAFASAKAGSRLLFPRKLRKE